MNIGDKLKEAREEQGLSIKEVQQATKIRAKYLKALEEENFDVIPGEAYVRAFLKGYGNYLKLNGVALVHEYRKIVEKEKEELQNENINEEDKRKNKTISWIIIAIAIIIIGVVIYNAFLLNHSRQGLEDLSDITVSQRVSSEEDKIQEQDTGKDSSLVDDGIDGQDLNETKNNSVENNTKDGQATQDSSQNRSINNEETSFFEGEKDNTVLAKKDDEQELGFEEDKFQTSINEEEKTLTVIINDRVWVRILVDGEKVFEGILSKGDRKEFTGNEEMELKIGNAIGVQVKRGDEILGPWGKSGEVISKVVEF